MKIVQSAGIALAAIAISAVLAWRFAGTIGDDWILFVHYALIFTAILLSGPVVARAHWKIMVSALLLNGLILGASTPMFDAWYDAESHQRVLAQLTMHQAIVSSTDMGDHVTYQLSAPSSDEPYIGGYVVPKFILSPGDVAAAASLGGIIAVLVGGLIAVALRCMLPMSDPARERGAGIAGPG